MGATTTDSSTIAIFGDLSGHLHPFEEALKRLGAVPETATVPDGLLVVQVGDLVHRGPDSDAIVDLVDRMMDANRATLNADKRQLRLLIGSRPFWGIDPGFRAAPPAAPLHPLVLHRAAH